MADTTAQANSVLVTAATAALGGAAETIWHQAGVIVVGAVGGAFWALMRLEKSTGLSGALKFMAPRAVLSLCLTYLPALYLQDWLQEHQHNVPLTAALLAVAFSLSCAKELVTEARPIYRAIRGIKDEPR